MSPLADCMLSLMLGLYAILSSWQVSSNIATTWQPLSRTHSSFLLVSTSVKMDHTEVVLVATVSLSGSGSLPLRES